LAILGQSSSGIVGLGRSSMKHSGIFFSIAKAISQDLQNPIRRDKKNAGESL